AKDKLFLLPVQQLEDKNENTELERGYAYLRRFKTLSKAFATGDFRSIPVQIKNEKVPGPWEKMTLYGKLDDTKLAVARMYKERQENRERVDIKTSECTEDKAKKYVSDTSDNKVKRHHKQSVSDIGLYTFDDKQKSIHESIRGSGNGDRRCKLDKCGETKERKKNRTSVETHPLMSLLSLGNDSNTDDDSSKLNRPLLSNSAGGIHGGDMPWEEETKLVYGVIFSLRNLVSKISGKNDGFVCYKTNTYKLHFFETASGLKFVLNSDPNVENLREALRTIYIQIYVETVAKNPLVKFDSPIENDLFCERLDTFIKTVPGFE
ncbi:hypothetical protein HK096_003018, partial [Nowakowskiella sp. JEL0078]